MSTRTYSGTLVLEGIFDAIPTSNTLLTSVADQVFSPQVEIVEEDCETQLGNIVTLTFETEGSVEALTGTVITPAYIEDQLENGIYLAQVRTASRCISKGGLCKICYRSARPRDTVTDVGDRVKFDPEFILQTELVSFPTDATANLTFSELEYDSLYVYKDGILLPESDYTVSGNEMTILFPTSYPLYLTVKYTVVSRVPFFYWLAGTFAGSLLGIQALPIDSLSLKPSLFSSLLPESEIDSIVSKVRRSAIIPEEIKDYLNESKSKMERALLAIAADSLFSNATS